MYSSIQKKIVFLRPVFCICEYKQHKAKKPLCGHIGTTPMAGEIDNDPNVYTYVLKSHLYIYILD